MRAHPDRRVRRILQRYVIGDQLPALTCVLADTKDSLCILNVSPDEVIRSLFYNKANDSLITVSGIIYTNRASHCSLTGVASSVP